jgi:hypothetical protein
MKNGRPFSLGGIWENWLSVTHRSSSADGDVKITLRRVACVLKAPFNCQASLA